jgi:hypothetical protein
MAILLTNYKKNTISLLFTLCTLKQNDHQDDQDVCGVLFDGKHVGVALGDVWEGAVVATEIGNAVENGSTRNAEAVAKQ